MSLAKEIAYHARADLVSRRAGGAAAAVTAASRQPDDGFDYHARLEPERATPKSRDAGPKFLAAGSLVGQLRNEAGNPKAQTRLAVCSGEGDRDRAQRDTANATRVFVTPLPPARPSRCEPREGPRRPRRPPPTRKYRGL
jgi:TPR repeat protein